MSPGPLAGPGDGELVEALRAGDTAAFAALYRAHAKAVHGVAASYLHDPAAVADVVQEVFAKALERLPSLRDPDRFRPWLMAIARHAAVDEGRERGRVGHLGEGQAEGLADSAPGPEALAELAELAGLLRRSVVGLSTRDATAVFLVTQLGYAPAEVAVVLGVTPGAAKVIVHRARRRLRDALVLDVLARGAATACPEFVSKLDAHDVVGAAHHVRTCAACAEKARHEVEIYDAGSIPPAG